MFKRSLLMEFFIIFLVITFSVSSYFLLINAQVTFTSLKMDEKQTMEKYKNVWNDRTIIENKLGSFDYGDSEIVATITIPKMGIYELPIYYGVENENKNWQITTIGAKEGWSMIGADGVALIGAHNNQIFDNLSVLEPGDLFIIENNVDVYIFEVVDTTIFNHELDKWSETAMIGKYNHSVNLVTCYPENSINTEDRYLVFTKLVKGTIFK